MILLDTDTCIALLRGEPAALAHFEAAAHEDVATTWVTAAELFFGAARSAHPAENAAIVLRFLPSVRVVPPDLVSARLFGEVKATLRARGEIVADADLWIAATALAHGATLVTGNRRHFGRIAGLVCENWIRVTPSA